MKAVQFGAGNIGRGFIAQLFHESGYEVVFVDVSDELVSLINKRGSYPIYIVGDNPETVNISKIRAVNGKDIDAVANEILSASIVCTAVGVNVLKHVAPAIAKGILLRSEQGVSEPLNIIICENLLNAKDIMRGYIREHLPKEHAEYMNSQIGIVESVVSRMVPVMTDEQRQKDPLSVHVEAYKKLPVDRNGFVGDIPEIVGLEPKGNFGAYVERKLFTHNLGHAAFAYLGYLRGHEYIYQAVADPLVHSIVKGVLDETGRAQIEKNGFTKEEHQAHIDDLLHRFSNVALGDTVARVGRDPIRKLGPNDRLIGGMKLASEFGISPKNISLAAAAAMLYDNPEDEAAVKLQSMLKTAGLDAVLEKICGMKPECELSRMIVRQLEALKSGGIESIVVEV
ncbi:MAG: mannitol-1-phosphate 5-dehydrogenase [Armatimonadota bacterium]